MGDLGDKPTAELISELTKRFEGLGMVGKDEGVTKILSMNGDPVWCIGAARMLEEMARIKAR